MANEKRLICLDHALQAVSENYRSDMPKHDLDMLVATRKKLKAMPTVDAVPVDEIRVDIMSLSLENQEAILNVSICGKPNEVKIPFSKEVAEVVHGRWGEKILVGGFAEEWGYVCSECGCTVSDRSNLGIGRYASKNQRLNYCPNCGAKMDGDGND